MYKNEKLFDAAFYLKRKLPMAIVHNASRVFGTKSFKGKMDQLKDAIEKCDEINVLFKPFTKNEWIFSNTKAYKIFKHMSDEEKKIFNFDVTRIKWRMFVMNHAYGIKRFILKEEAE